MTLDITPIHSLYSLRQLRLLEYWEILQYFEGWKTELICSFKHYLELICSFKHYLEMIFWSCAVSMRLSAFGLAEKYSVEEARCMHTFQ
mmetsp:Transcript_224/g.290  ORF Transcript_224/g.290 Transcript_224/m.290 type:complete len:89 (+) Transcript_224:3-269(+)